MPSSACTKTTRGGSPGGRLEEYRRAWQGACGSGPEGAHERVIDAADGGRVHHDLLSGTYRRDGVHADHQRTGGGCAWRLAATSTRRPGARWRGDVAQDVALVTELRPPGDQWRRSGAICLYDR